MIITFKNMFFMLFYLFTFTLLNNFTFGQCKGYNPRSMGLLEKEEVVREANFDKIIPYIRKFQYDKAISLIQQIMDSYTTEPKIQIVGYYRLYEVFGSAGKFEGEMRNSPEKQLNYYNMALKALEQCEKLIRSQPINDKETLYKDILNITIPVGYIFGYAERGYVLKQLSTRCKTIMVKDHKETTPTLNREAGEADFRKSLEIARRLIKQDPNSPAADFIVNAFDRALGNLYKSSDYEQQLKALIDEFSGTILEKRFRENLARHHFRKVYQSNRDFFRTIDELIEKHGKTSIVERLFNEYKNKIMEDFSQRHELIISIKSEDNSTSPTIIGKNNKASYGINNPCASRK